SISLTSDRGQEARAARAELLPQLGDVHVDGARLHVLDVVHAPHLAEQRAAADDAARLFREEPQNLDLASGELDLSVVRARHPAPRMDLEGPDVKARRLEPARALEHHLDARDELTHAERLRHVVVRAGSEPAEQGRKSGASGT